MAKKKKREGDPSFEESLDELQQIVTDLEDGQLGLSESIERFEQGMTLLRGCYSLLQDAEQKIELLTGFDRDGNPLTEEFDASASADQQQPRAGRRKRAAETAEDNDDDGSATALF